MTIRQGAGCVRFGEDMVGAATGKPDAGAAECVCHDEKAQGFFLRESRASRSAVFRPPADHGAPAFHRDINL
jgi:hypothetical protein